MPPPPCLCPRQGVRDIWFSNDGRRFVSTGYDKVVRYWDTETGKVLGSFGQGRMCYCVRLHPEEQNVLMAGTQDKKILQWDMDSGELVQVGGCGGWGGVGMLLGRWPGGAGSGGGGGGGGWLRLAVGIDHQYPGVGALVVASWHHTA